MGRPLNKKYFGNRNIGSTSVTTDDSIGGNGIASVTIAGSWSGFTQATSTVTFSAPQLPGGVTLDGDKLYDEATTEIKELEDELMTKSAPLEFFMG